MKRVMWISLFVLAAAAMVAVLIKPAIILLAEKQIKNISAGATVSIQGCDLKAFHELRLLELEIQKPSFYDFKAKEISIQYNPLSLLRRSLQKVSLKDAALVIDFSQQETADSNRYMMQRSPVAGTIKTLEVANLKLDVKSKDVRLNAKISTEFDLTKLSLNSLDLKILSMDAQNFLLEEGALNWNQRQSPGKLFIQKVQYDKIKASVIKAEVRLKEKELILDSLSGQALNGEFSGTASLKVDGVPEYLARLQFTNLDLERFTSDFELKEKFQMSGLLNGNITISGRGLDVQILDGAFSATAPGGALVIKNNEFLERLARNTEQPVEIVVGSLKNYHYNTGIINLSLKEGNLILDMALDGETGKRNINITLHDFNLRKDK